MRTAKLVMAIHVVSGVMAVNVVQTVAGWHGYAWGFWQVFGYVLLVSALTGHGAAERGHMLQEVLKHQQGERAVHVSRLTLALVRLVMVGTALLVVRSL